GIGRRSRGPRARHRPGAGGCGRLHPVGRVRVHVPARAHAAMKHVVPVRRALAVRTIFNFLGPLTNPAGATRQLIGVSEPDYLETIAAALARLGSERALVVSGADGVDEVSASGPTQAVELRDGKLRPAT